MKPKKILAFLFLIFAVVVVSSLLFPEKGIAIGDSFRLKFHWSFNQLSQKNIQYADIKEIIDENESIIRQDTLLIPLYEPKKAIDTIKASAASLNKKVQQLEYPSGDNTILLPFFEKLAKSGKKRVRVLHYGDSQIEGDRITGYLRNRFQRHFGGSGPGLLSAIPGRAESSSIRHTASKNWISHSIYYRRDTILPHRKFGILGNFSRFTSYVHDTLSHDSLLHIAEIEFAKSGMAYASVNNFTQCRIFYGHCNSQFIIKGFVNDSLIWFEDIGAAQITQQIKWNFQKTPRQFRIEFEGTKSPDVYSVALDAPTGVAVDNLSFRGSSGTEFTRLDYTQLKQMAGYLKTGLIIYEFGVNVVPHQVKGYTYYEHAIIRQIKYLKAIFPNTPVLIVGLSDMSQHKGSYYESYPNIEKIIKAQRNAARKTNSAFWDLYTAMGGKNSMPSWVFAEPALARKDFTHFNRKGGHIVAQMLYNALMQEYEKYLSKKEGDKTKIAVN